MDVWRHIRKLDVRSISGVAVYREIIYKLRQRLRKRELPVLERLRDLVPVSSVRFDACIWFVYVCLPTPYYIASIESRFRERRIIKNQSNNQPLIPVDVNRQCLTIGVTGLR